MSPDFCIRHSTEIEATDRPAGEDMAIFSGSYTATHTISDAMHTYDCTGPCMVRY